MISVDSMQIYREMDIGTAKPTIEERRGVTHHMIDVADPEDEFAVAEFRDMARNVIEGTGRPMVISGGSGLHFRAVVDPMTFAPTDLSLREHLETRELTDLAGELISADPSAGRHVDLANRRRVVRALEIFQLTGHTPSGRAASREAAAVREYVPEFEFSAVGVDPGPALDHRIDERVSAMMAAGLVDEVERLWPRMGRTARGAVGYREIGSYLDGQSTLEGATQAIGSSTRRLARRQRTWFRRDPRITWIGWSDDPGERLGSVVEVLG